MKIRGQRPGVEHVNRNMGRRVERQLVVCLRQTDELSSVITRLKVREETRDEMIGNCVISEDLLC